MAVESNPKCTKGEFTMLMMKFSANKWIENLIEQMDIKISKLLDFEFTRHQVLENRSLFKDLVIRFDTTENFITGDKLNFVNSLLELKLENELERVRQVKSNSDNYVNAEFG